MFEVFVRTQFSAAHRLKEYAGNCARWHGHNWDVRVTLGAEDLDRLGLAVDFRELKQALKQLLDELDHSDLNEYPPFAGMNPSCEVIARHLYKELAKHFSGNTVRVLRVQVCETPNAGAVYYE
jgi:6-pyruvoyltetrahydropterin/6-carboxytetrahydropterin synthase